MSFPWRLCAFLDTDGRTARIVAVVFFASAAVLADEIVLIRLLSFRFFPYFAPLVISQALLGIGGSGVALHFLRPRLARDPAASLAWAVLLSAPSYDLAFRFSQAVPFDPFSLLLQPSAWPVFAVFFALLSVPFFLGGLAAGIPFVFGPGKAGPLYAATFAGSAAGAAAAFESLSVLATESLCRVPVALALAAGLLLLFGGGKRLAPGRGAVAAGTVLLLLLPPPVLRASPYKDVEQFRRLPAAQTIAARRGPSGDLRVIYAPGIHSAPGLGLRFAGRIPPQAAIFWDGELRGIVPRKGGESPPGYLDFLPEALPYRILSRPAVLQFGLRGTEGVLAAARGGAATVTVVEPAAELVRLVGEDLLPFSGGWPAGAAPEVIVDAPRAFLARERRRFDLIEVFGVSSATFASLGVHAAGETYLLTREGVRAMFARLSSGGIVAFSGWLKIPPRESVKILHMLREELGRQGLSLSDRLLVVQGFVTFVAVVGKKPFGAAQKKAAAAFCAENGFSLVWPRAEGSAQAAAGLEERAFAEAVADAASRGKFREEGLFDLRPVTDDSPYFHRFVRPRSLPQIRRLLGGQWVPFVEWGVVFLLLSAVVSPMVAAVSLLPPALAARRAGGRTGPSAFGYFCVLGLAYMCFEISFIKAGILFLGDPMRAAAWTIGGFSFFSGLGSAVSARIARGPAAPPWLFPGIAVAATAAFLCLWSFAGTFLALAKAARLALCVLLPAPAAFLMGIPFPAAVARLAEADPSAVPLAWGANGFFSVVGAQAATAAALFAGLRATVFAGALLYLAARALFPQLAALRERAAGGGVPPSPSS